jgi:hypothetical protein
MGAVMNDLLEFIEDLEAAEADPSLLKNMILDYKERVEIFEREYEMDDGA